MKRLKEAYVGNIAIALMMIKVKIKNILIVNYLIISYFNMHLKFSLFAI